MDFAHVNKLMVFLFVITVFSCVHRELNAQVFNGQPINATITNNAFWKRSTDDSATGTYSLLGTATVSGPSITNMQRQFNSTASFLGQTTNGVYNDLPSWTNNDVGLTTNPVGTRADVLTGRFNKDVGHTHAGTVGEGPKLTNVAITANADIDRSKIAPGTVNSFVFNDASTGYMTSITGVTVYAKALPLVSKGQIVTHDGVSPVAFDACANGEMVQWDSTQTKGIKCVSATPPAVSFTMQQTTTPANPAALYDKIYVKSDDSLYILNSAGTEVKVGPGGTSSGNAIRFVQSGGLGGTYKIFDGDTRCNTTKTLSTVTVSLYNSGDSGFTGIELYKNGIDMGMVTAPANGTRNSKKNTVSIPCVDGDLLWPGITVNPKTGAPEELTVEFEF